jgi:hypothetical protein
LENIPPSWPQTFLHDWGILETAKALALSEGTKIFDETASQIILAAVGRLKLLVLEEIDDPQIILRILIGHAAEVDLAWQIISGTVIPYPSPDCLECHAMWS